VARRREGPRALRPLDAKAPADNRDAEGWQKLLRGIEACAAHPPYLATNERADLGTNLKEEEELFRSDCWNDMRPADLPAVEP
jgi:hypothetical protein